MPHRDIIVIGASSGGVHALCELCQGLPADFPATIFVVIHIGANPSKMPDILRSCGKLQAEHALDGVRPQPGRIYVAPPDRHMLIEQGAIRLTRGPKEHHTRPSIDPLFRSAALDCGRRVIGVVLSGHLDDGTLGMKAIRACGGVLVVQDPADAEAGSMPQSVLENVGVDHCLSLMQIAQTLTKLASEPLNLPPLPPPQWLVQEHLASLSEGQSTMENLEAIGKHSSLVCPECTGSLWELQDNQPLRYRCHTGHAYSLQSLAYHQRVSTEATLWSAVRALQDRELVLRKMAGHSRSIGNPGLAQAQENAADLIAAHALQVQELAQDEMESLQSERALPERPPLAFDGGPSFT
jgi:two-component system chemotaxis response regulator CheB